MKRKIEFVKTREKFNGDILFTVRIENLFIHSKYYPLVESERYVNSLDVEGKRRILVYGLGLGYHILKMLDIFNCIELIDVYELSYDLYDCNNSSAFKIIDILKANPKVKIHIKEYGDNFFNDLSKSMSECDDFIVYNPCLKSILCEFIEFKESIMEFQAQKKAESVFKDRMDFNKIRNEELEAGSLKEFFEKNDFKGKNAIILAAGPSLGDCFSELRKIQKREDVFIIAVGTSLKVSLSNGIVPDAFCMLDCLDILYDQVSGIENQNMSMLFLNTSSSKAAESYNGPKYIYYNSHRGDNMVVNCANSVATAAISIALLGKAKRVVLVGQDLAYVNNKAHVDDTVYGKVNLYSKRSGDLEAFDVNGNKIYTNKFYLSIKKWIEKTSEYNPHTEFVNCSSGINIIGCTNLRIEDLKNYL